MEIKLTYVSSNYTYYNISILETLAFEIGSRYKFFTININLIGYSTKRSTTINWI